MRKQIITISAFGLILACTPQMGTDYSNTYPASEKARYVSECVEAAVGVSFTNQQVSGQCNCMVNNIVKTVPYTTFEADASNGSNIFSTTPPYKDIAQQCALTHLGTNYFD